MEVTKQVKPGQGMNQAATKVNVLSPVIADVVEVDVFVNNGRQYHHKRDGKSVMTLSGSEAVA